jgi:hypothetical protein
VGFLYTLWPSELSILVFMKMSGNGSVFVLFWFHCTRLLGRALLTVHLLWCFHTRHPINAFLSHSLPLIMSRLSTPWSRKIESQVTKAFTLSYPTFLDPRDWNNVTRGSDPLAVSFHHFLYQKSWLCVGVLWKKTMFRVFWRLIVKQKSWTLTVAYPHLYHVNGFGLSHSFY